MFPDGWHLEKLGSLFDFKNGVNTEAANYGSGLKFVNVMDVFNNHSLTCEKIKERVNVSKNKSDIYLLEYGDVLFNRTSETYDEIGLSTVYLDSKPAIFGGFVIRARQTTGKLDPDYCVYSFLSREVRKEIIRRGQGAIRTNIGQGDMRKVPLLIPPLPEQKKIAKILSTWGQAITTTEQLITNSQQQKKALMQQLLTGKKHLAGFSGEWEEVRLEYLIDGKKRKGKIASTNEDRKGLPYIGSTSFGGDFDLFTDSEKAIKCDIDDLLILWDGENAGKSTTGLVGVVSSTVVRFKLKKELSDSIFLHSLFIHDNYKIRAIREGSGIPHMPKDFERWYKVNLPNLKEQQKIAQVLTSADQEIETLQQKLKFLKEEKKALMQQLLTGKRRVKLTKQETENA